MSKSKPFKKVLSENPEKRLSLKLLSPNPIGVINRRNGCGTTLLKKGLTEKPKKRRDQLVQRLRVNGCRSRGLNYDEDAELSQGGLFTGKINYSSFVEEG